MNFPKMQSPFIRDIYPDKRYLCTSKIDDSFRWVFTDESIAVDKIDGTNIYFEVEDKSIKQIYNKHADHTVDIWKKPDMRVGEGILRSMMKKYVQTPDRLKPGIYCGELIGESIQGNPYKVDGHLWIPFDRMRNNYIFKFWFDFVKTLEGRSDEEIYEAVSDVFKGLWSIFKRNFNKMSLTDSPVTESTKFEGMAAEGIVFYRKGKEGYGQCAKLRRDMFEWFTGDDHQTHEYTRKKSRR